ncbi:hypothetical protein BJX70DRAFT_397300 [Aspergillus crustosus]
MQSIPQTHPMYQSTSVSPARNPTPPAPQQSPPRDSWYGVNDAAERRKRQNRLNQRAHRRRKQEELDFAAKHRQSTSKTSPATQPASTHKPGTSQQLASTVIPNLLGTRWLNHPSPKKREILLRQLAEYHNSLILGCPTSSHLFTLTRVNVHRAFVANMVTLGIPWDLIVDDDAISPFVSRRPIPPPPSSSSSTTTTTTTTASQTPYPITLHPTPLQQTLPHHTWLDLFPCPTMRNNLIARGNEWDDESLCTDIMGYWEGSATGETSLIVWGEPSDPGSWEVTEGFLEKWGWVVEGCEGLMRATDFWRGGRGEEPLFGTRGVGLGHGG